MIEILSLLKQLTDALDRTCMRVCNHERMHPEAEELQRIREELRSLLERECELL